MLFEIVSQCETDLSSDFTLSCIQFVECGFGRIKVGSVIGLGLSAFCLFMLVFQTGIET